MNDDKDTVIHFMENNDAFYKNFILKVEQENQTTYPNEIYIEILNKIINKIEKHIKPYYLNKIADLINNKCNPESVSYIILELLNNNNKSLKKIEPLDAFFNLANTDHSQSPEQFKQISKLLFRDFLSNAQKNKQIEIFNQLINKNIETSDLEKIAGFIYNNHSFTFTSVTTKLNNGVVDLRNKVTPLNYRLKEIIQRIEQETTKTLNIILKYLDKNQNKAEDLISCIVGKGTTHALPERNDSFGFGTIPTNKEDSHYFNFAQFENVYKYLSYLKKNKKPTDQLGLLFDTSFEHQRINKVSNILMKFGEPFYQEIREYIFPPSSEPDKISYKLRSEIESILLSETFQTNKPLLQKIIITILNMPDNNQIKSDEFIYTIGFLIFSYNRFDEILEKFFDQPNYFFALEQKIINTRE